MDGQDGNSGLASTAAEAKAIAKEAWLYAYAPLQGYQTMFNQALDTDFPGYVGGFNRYRHYARMATPDDTDIVTPNNDTPYSWAWLDLRAEPMVLSVPAITDRYYVNQWFDMYTHNFAYTGTRATGTDAGNYLFAGPGWKGPGSKGDVPAGITKVFHAETDFIGTLTRTQLHGTQDIAAMQAVQAQFRLQPLSAFAGTAAPAPAPAFDWPVWDSVTAEGIGFIGMFNRLLELMPPLASETAMLARFARIGIGAGKPFDPAALDPALRTVLEAGVAEASAEFQAWAATLVDSKPLFGTRQELGADYIKLRSGGAALGLFGNTKEEAVYGGYQVGPDGKVLDGTKRWVIRFEPGKWPPTRLFWSFTMYNLPQRFLVANPIDRYSIGSETPGLQKGADGSLEIYLQHDSPGPDKQTNWLPTPPAPFFLVGRYYGPEQPLIDGSWQQPALVLTA